MKDGSLYSVAMLEKAKIFVRKRPMIYYAAHRLRGGAPHLAVNRSTELVIEGFPRSANTFAMLAFEQAQRADGRKPLRIAHHLHAPAQIIQAARRRIPCLVLIREPVGATASLIARHPRTPVGAALAYYASFYETVARYRSSYVLGPFEEVIGNYGAVIERLNERFGTRFAAFEHTEENIGTIFSQIDEIDAPPSDDTRFGKRTVARPSPTGGERRVAVEIRLKEPGYAALLARAKAAHARLLASQ